MSAGRVVVVAISGIGVLDFVTHYHLPDRRPFLNLSDLEAARRDEVMSELIALRRAGKQSRPFGRRYAEWREMTEARLRDLFIAVGGKPIRRAPHYFVLGRSSWFEGLASDMRAIVMPVADLPMLETSFTLIDSFGAMGYASRFGYPDNAQPHERLVYRLDQLARTIEAYGVPAGGDERFIEVQLWSDGPIAKHLHT